MGNDAPTLWAATNKGEWRRRRWQANGRKCEYCNQGVTFKGTSIDHIVPRAKGGPDSPTNYAVVCRNCNKLKADHDLEYFMQNILPLKIKLGSPNSHMVRTLHRIHELIALSEKEKPWRIAEALTRLLQRMDSLKQDTREFEVELTQLTINIVNRF